MKTATDERRSPRALFERRGRITERGPALNSAVQYFNQAIALDPNYAAAWAGLGQAYELLPWYKLALGKLRLPGQTAAERA